jgi:hypothetical protein
MKSNAKTGWLKASLATHGDGNTSRGAAKKSPSSSGTIKTYDGPAKPKAPKAANQSDKAPATYGTSKGGGDVPQGKGDVTYAKGLMQKGK